MKVINNCEFQLVERYILSGQLEIPDSSGRSLIDVEKLATIEEIHGKA